MRITKDELIAKVKAYTGDRTDDETLSLIEDVTDTITDGVDWESRYNDLAKKYKDRFTDANVEEKETIEDHDEKEDIKIDDLFKEGE